MRTRKLLVLVVVTLNLLTSGCWSSREVNTLGISVCLGIDKSKDGYVVSEQVINPKAIASKRPTNEAPVFVFSGEGENIQQIIKRMTTLLSRGLYHSHLRMVVISEEVAKEGISDIIDYLLRFHEFRTDYYFAIAKGVTAKEVLSLLTPIESIPGVGLYNRLQLSYEKWAPTKAIRIIELANSLAAEGVNPAITSIEIVDGGTKTDSTDALIKTDDFEKLRYTSVGAFRRDQLVGWLDEDEAKGYNYITNNVKQTSGYSTDGDIMIASDVPRCKSKIDASVVDHQPRINVEVEFEYVLTQVRGDIDVSKVENIEKINQINERKVTEMCSNSVDKAKELKTDIFGFGERIHAKDPAYWETVKDNWNEVFTTLPVNVKVTAKIISTGDLKKQLTQK